MPTYSRGSPYPAGDSTPGRHNHEVGIVGVTRSCHGITGRDASTRCATYRWTVRPGTSASRDRYVAVRADSTRASCIDGGGTVASCTAPNTYLLPDNYLLPAGGSYYLSRGIYAGSERVTRSRQRCLAQRIKGPPRFGTRRSVKPSAQPTLVRTQHPPLEKEQLHKEKLDRYGRAKHPKGDGLPDRRLSRSFQLGGGNIYTYGTK